MIEDYKKEVYEIGSLCVPSPFFQDNWIGYWLIVELTYDETIDDLFVTLYGLNVGKQLTIPYSELQYYFTCISGKSIDTWTYINGH